ncbi:MAG TPA: HAD-IIIA family hydrolase, partial [Candidatus Omnitrophota bacterium]|nr:HAD-IIIA family hydrolase [Candidatus Omnitrophota bacterium]
RVNNRLLDMLKMKGTGVDDVFICFHHPVGDRDAKDRFLIKKCDCRKPAAGLLKQAMKKHNIDMARSYMVGDSYTDVMAGYAAGVKTVFLGRYKCDACQRMGKVKADYIFDDIKGFADFISEEKGKKWCKRKRQR